MTIQQRIKELLDNGQKVMSNAAGRIGEVIRADSGASVAIKLRRSKEIGVTTFDSGDKVELIERNGIWYVENVFE